MVDADLWHEGFKHVTKREFLRIEGGPRARVDRLGEGRETSKDRRRQRLGPLLLIKERRFLMYTVIITKINCKCNCNRNYVIVVVLS